MEGRRVRNLDEDLKNVEFETSEEVEVTPTFDGMGIREDLLRGIYAYGKGKWHNFNKNRPLFVCKLFSTSGKRQLNL